MQTTTTYEFERPEGWNGEVVDMDTYAGEVDYFECEIEADVTIEIENNYGADADGNRGGYADFSYVEDITIILDGDFRPFGRKVRDFFRSFTTSDSWESFPGNVQYRFKGLSDDILSSKELADIEDTFLEEARSYDGDY